MKNTQRESLKKSIEDESIRGIEFDENGDPVGCYTPVEVLDRLDRKLVDTFGEEARLRVNARREEWNRRGTWHFEMF